MRPTSRQAVARERKAAAGRHRGGGQARACQQEPAALLESQRLTWAGICLEMILSKMVGAPLSAWAALRQRSRGQAAAVRVAAAAAALQPSAPSLCGSCPDRSREGFLGEVEAGRQPATATQFRPAHSRSLRPLHLAGHGPDDRWPAAGARPTALQLGTAEPGGPAGCDGSAAEPQVLQHRCFGSPLPQGGRLNWLPAGQHSRAQQSGPSSWPPEAAGQTCTPANIVGPRPCT